MRGQSAEFSAPEIEIYEYFKTIMRDGYCASPVLGDRSKEVYIAGVIGCPDINVSIIGLEEVPLEGFPGLTRQVSGDYRHMRIAPNDEVVLLHQFRIRNGNVEEFPERPSLTDMLQEIKDLELTARVSGRLMDRGL